MSNLTEVFSKLKKTNLKNYTVSMYVIKRNLRNRKANYTVFFTNIDEKLRKKLKDIAINQINESKNVKDYDFFTTDLDNSLLGINTSETDMLDLIKTIENSADFDDIKNEEDLFNSWIYLTKLSYIEEPSLYFVRKISDGWRINKKFSIDLLKFEDNKLMDIGEKKFFRIDNKVDFFVYEDCIFIADKKNFEIALNFRDGMIKNRDDMIKEFESRKLFVDTTKLTEIIGDNSHRLRKLSQVKKAGYYKNNNYLEQLKIVSNQQNWGIQYNISGEIKVSEDNIDLILKLLNNDRLNSLINGEGFDVDNKNKI